MHSDIKIHLDNFDLGRLVSLYRKNPSALALPTTLTKRGVSFLISPSTYSEALNSAKGPKGVRYTAPILIIMDMLAIVSHPSPHVIISSELYPYVAHDFASKRDFEKFHLSVEVLTFLRRELPKQAIFNALAVAPIFSVALKLNALETSNFTALLDELYSLQLMEARGVGPLSPEQLRRVFCTAVANMRGIFEITNSNFEDAILGYNREQGAQRLMGSLALKSRITSKQPASTPFKAKGEARYRDIINDMLRGWGYTLCEKLAAQDVAETFPSLRCHSTYWATRQPGADMSMNNLCDAIQLLYLPHVDLFSVDKPVFQDIFRVIPSELRKRLHNNGTFWAEAAHRCNVDEGLGFVVDAYGKGSKTSLS